MKYDFINKNIIVTGGSSGIGLALVQSLIEAGAKIWIIARNEEKILAVINQLGDKKNQLNYYLADVQDFSEIEPISEKLNNENIKLDGLINSAGVAHPAEFDSMEIEKFHWLMDINYFGTVHCVKAFLPLMNSGSFIVNISSMAGMIGVYGYTAYGASKFAVRGFSDALRSELKPKNIQVSIVFPPDTDTPQLEYESEFKPEITKKIAGSAKVMSAQKVALVILDGIKKKQYIIIPGFESNLIYHLSNFLGPLIYPIMDFLVFQAMKEINHKKLPD
jgi:3-dehydrosphinganine reductase